MERINLILKKLEGIQSDGFLVTAPENVTYLTGFTGDSSHLIISNAGCVLLTDGRYTEQAKIECHKPIEVFNWINNNRFGIETYQYFIENYSIQRLVFEGEKLSYSDYSKLSQSLKNVLLTPVSNLVEDFRKIKDDNEIEFLSKACEISDLALELTIPCIKPGVTEIEIAAQLEYNIRCNGADDISFTTIVLSGARTSLLHGKPGDKKIEAGGYLLFDFGALYKGYHADISRTFIVGKANDKQKRIYAAIQNAQMQAVQSLKPGLEGYFPDKIVRDIIPRDLIDFYYPGLGHGVGLQIHEIPFIKNISTFNFEKGMVITIEPGIYIPGWGGLRIEDTVLITDNSYNILTKSNRNLTEL